MIITLRLPAPLAPAVLDIPPTSLASDLLESLPYTLDGYLRTRTAILSETTPLSTLDRGNADFPLEVELVPRVRGGKGGFGANLRAAGGRMNASKSTNFDSCRDLSGRRLGAVKEAQRQAELVESLPELKAKAAAEEKAKLEAIERRLGISAAESNGEGTKRLAEVDVEELARKKIKFEDTKFLEESREIKESVRNAVGAALLKKKKKKSPPTEETKDDKKDDKKAAVATKPAASKPATAAAKPAAAAPAPKTKVAA